MAVCRIGADSGVNLPIIRLLVDRLVGWLIVLCVMLAAIPVLVLLLFVVLKGLPGILTPGFFTDPPHPQGVPGGGVFNAIIGTVEIVGIASLLAVPVGALIGIFLSEYGRNQVGDTVRFISDVLTGLPSIAFGIFAYTVVVLTTHHFSGLAASIALAVLMLPLILRATETALVLVPQSLREAGLALGAPRWRVTLEIVVPAALGGMVTGALLAMARAAGETAPLLFTALGNDTVQTNPLQPMGALALTVFRNALLPYQNVQDQAWAAALLLVIMVATTNVLARIYVRRVQR
jgi:phosphate transport system permease protein